MKQKLTAKTLMTRLIQQWIAAAQQPANWLLEPASGRTIAAGLSEFNQMQIWLSQNVKGGGERNELNAIFTKLQNMLSSWRDAVKANNVTLFNARTFRDALRNVLTAGLAFVAQLEESGVGIAPGEDDTGTKTLLQGPNARTRRAEQVQIDTYDWKAYEELLPQAVSRTSANEVKLRLTVLPVLKGIVTAQRLVNYGIHARQLGDYVLLDNQMILAVRTSYLRKDFEDDIAREAYMTGVLAKLREKHKQEFALVNDTAFVVPDRGYTFFWIAPSAFLATLRNDVHTRVENWSLA